MQSKIEEFYVYETTYLSWLDRGEDYDDIKEQISGRLKRLVETLTEDQKMMVKELTLLYYKKEGLAEQASYKAGFKTGLTVAVEALAT